jgi:hypothetical protein
MPAFSVNCKPGIGLQGQKMVPGGRPQKPLKPMIKKLFDNPSGIILALVIIGIGVLLFIQGCPSYIRGKQIAKISTLQEIKKDSTQYWKDQYGREHATRKQSEASLAELELVYFDELDRKTDELNIKSKQIRSLTGVVTSRTVLLDSLLKTRRGRDTTFLPGKPGDPDTLVIRDTIPLGSSVTFVDSLSITDYIKKHGFLKLKRTRMLDVTNYAPNGAKVTSVSGFTVKNAESLIRIRPTGSVLIFPDRTLHFSAGGGLEFRILKIPVFISLQKVF